MSDLKLYRAKLKTRKQIMAEIPREHQGWWADVCAGETLELRDATEADLERCSLNRDAPRDPAEYLCENIERGSLVRRIAVAELTEITPRGLVAQHNETNALRARIKELEGELARRTQPEAAPAQEPEFICEITEGTVRINPYGDEPIISGKRTYTVNIPAAQDLSAAIDKDAKIAAQRARIMELEEQLARALGTPVNDWCPECHARESSGDALSAGDRVDALQEIATKLRRAGADIPAPQHDDAIKGATINGLSIALLLVDEAILQSQKGGSNG